MMMMMTTQAGSLPASLLVAVVLGTVMILVITAMEALHRRKLAKKDRSIRTLTQDIRHVEDQLTAAERPALYTEVIEGGFTQEAPLKRMGYLSLGEYERPELADRYEMAAEFLRNPSELKQLIVVLDTSEGAFLLPLREIPAVQPNAEALDLKLRFDSIQCGQAVNIFTCFIACDGFRLADVKNAIDMQAGDELNVVYTLTGDLT